MCKYDFTWNLVKSVSGRAGDYLQSQRNLYVEKDFLDFSRSISKQLTVAHGPFKGMIYPSFNVIGGSIYPRLLGCYESELHLTIERLLENDYSEVINIGCAEGYYAVGLALRLSKAKIFAYDTDESARKLCAEMGHVNNVDNRMSIMGLCSSENLGDFLFTKKGLIICDCEGYERELFVSNNVNNLERCDLLIELHHRVDSSIQNYISTLFERTHKTTLINSIEDMDKVKLYNYPELARLRFEAKLRAVSEYRSEIMRWIVIEAMN